MTDHVKHIYSGRVYQIMRDHGPNGDYLWSPWEFSIRTPTQKRAQFFKSCTKPDTMPTRYNISILQEIEWEDRKLRGSQPIVVRPPSKGENSQKNRAKVTLQKEPLGDYTIQDLAMELGCSPGQARKVLRGSKLVKPTGGWRWSSSKEAEPFRRYLRKNLKP